MGPGSNFSTISSHLRQTPAPNKVIIKCLRLHVPIPTSIRCAFAPTIGDFPRLVIIMLGPNIELYLVTVTENILYRENILVSEHLIGQSK